MNKRVTILILVLAMFVYNGVSYSKTYRSRNRSYSRSNSSIFKSSKKYNNSSKNKKEFSSFSFGNKSKVQKIKLSSTVSKKTYDKYLKNIKKFPKKDIPSSSSKYKSSKSYQNAYTNSRSYTKKSYSDYKYRYYSNRGYSAPNYYYQSYRSFGMWDSLFLWMMLDRISTPQYSRFYYNHSENPDVKNFIAEAKDLSNENIELKEKLDMMEVKIDKMKDEGVKVDSNYIPKDIKPELAYSQYSLEKNFHKNNYFSIKNITIGFIILIGIIIILSV